MKNSQIDIEGKNDQRSLLVISDFNLAAYLFANGVLFTLAEPKALPEERIEIYFQVEKSNYVNDLITDYLSDHPIGVQTFLKASKHIKNVMMGAVRSRQGAKMNRIHTTT